MQTDIDFSRFAAVFFETDPKKSFKQPKSKSATTETFLIPAPVPDQVPDIAQRLEYTDDFEYIAFGFLEQLEERSSCQPTLTSSSSECNGSISGCYCLPFVPKFGYLLELRLRVCISLRLDSAASINGASE